MRVCHITTVHPADDARIFHRMCRGLAERGVSVVLVGPLAAPLDSRVRMSPWNARIANAGRLRRAGLALRAALAERVDIYHFHDPELIPLGLALKTLKPASAVVYDVHEDYPAMMLEKYWLPRPTRRLISRGARLADRVAGVCLDGIVTADPGVEGDFRAIAPDKTVVYYNFPVLSLFGQRRGEEPAAKVDLIYLGGMSHRAGTFILLDALAKLAAHGVKPTLRLGGYTDGAAGRAAVVEAIRQRGLEARVDLQGRIRHSQVPAWLRCGRVGLVTLQPIAKFMKNIPSKMFEYWACGLPVIASDLPPIGRFLADGKNGLLFSPSDPDDLARAIRHLMEQPEEGEAMGRHGQQLVGETWNNEQQIDGLTDFYERIRKKIARE